MTTAIDREFIKPGTIFLRPSHLPTAQAAPYTFEAYLGEFVWSFGKWNTEDGWDDAQVRIGDAVDAASDGEFVGLSIDDFEKLREANKAAVISGPFAPKIRKMQKAIKSATRPASASAPKPAAEAS